MARLLTSRVLAAALVAVTSACGAPVPERPWLPVDIAVATATGGAYAARADGAPGHEVAAGACPANRGGVGALALAPDGRRLAFACEDQQSTSARGLHVVDLASGATTRLVDDHVAGAAGLAWSPDGKRLAYLVARELGPAPVAALELRAYDLERSTDSQLDQARYFVADPVWELDSSAVVYRVGSWESSTSPVQTYRAPVGAGAGTAWLSGIHAEMPGPGKRWLGVRERAGHGEVVELDSSGREVPRSATGPAEYPVGWFGDAPVIWRQASAASATDPGRGEVWIEGAAPRLVGSGLPRPEGATGPVALAGDLLAYAEGGRTEGAVWLVSLPDGRRWSLDRGGRAPLELR